MKIPEQKQRVEGSDRVKPWERSPPGKARILTQRFVHLGLEWFQNLGKRLFPGSCLLCRHDAGAGAICPGCTASLPPAPRPSCPQCAHPTTHGERCGRCLHHGFAVDRTIATYAYAPPLDRLIQDLKYRHRLTLAEGLGQALTDSLCREASGEQFDVLIPMPLHATRLRERGFNQALEIARPLARLRRLCVDPYLLERTRATARQAALPRKDRLSNLQGAFECRGSLAGLHVLLVDDVLTTGASLHECARILKLHGAHRVTALVVARAVVND